MTGTMLDNPFLALTVTVYCVPGLNPVSKNMSVNNGFQLVQLTTIQPHYASMYMYAEACNYVLLYFELMQSLLRWEGSRMST